MTEMIERVARAIYAQMDQSSSDPWDEALLRVEKYGVTPPMVRMAREYARAAIEAMREPTPAMIEAGRRNSLTLEQSWKQMIDEALK